MIERSLSENTRRAYRADLDAFEAAGGTIPSTPDTVAAYLAELAETLRPASINRRLASISKAHEALGVENPTKAEIVRATMRGIRRTLGTAQREAKPLLKEEAWR